MWYLVLCTSYFLIGIVPSVQVFAETSNRATVLKMSIDEDGMYRIAYSDLLDCGLNPSEINPELMYLTNRGKIVPIYFTGVEHSSWNKTDYFDFYGTVNHDSSGNSDIYSDTNIYFLHWQEDRFPAVRYTICTASPLGKQVSIPTQPPLFKVKIHREEKSEQTRSQTLIEEGNGNWFWHEISAPGEISLSFNLPGQSLSTQAFCSVRIKFHGISHLNENPDHYVVIAINQNYIGEARWDGETGYIFSNDSIPVYYFQEGSNTLEISMPGAEGDPRGIAPDLDVVYLSWFEVDYWSEYRATNNYMAYYYGGDSTNFSIESTLTITNFSNKNIVIYDLTSQTKIIPFVTSTEMFVGDTVFAAYYPVSPQAPRHDCIALTEERIKPPVRLQKKQVSHWRNPSPGVDYIIITHPDFFESLFPLAEWRKSQGLQVQLVNAEDIYDEFNHGIMHPQAIRDFLAYISDNWKPPQLKYVLLVGDASWDIKNSFNLDYGRTFVPVYFSPSRTDYAACDNWYVSFTPVGGAPKVAIGRIPAHSVAEAKAVVNKILEYEQDLEYGAWRQSILLLATPRDWTERVHADLMEKIIPGQFNPIPKYATPATIAQYFIGPQDVIESINRGVFMVCYAGHASPFNWDIGRPGQEGLPETVGYKDRGFFGIQHVSGLHNRGKYPLVIAMTCYANQFDSIWADGIGETLLKADRAGAIACIGGTYRVSEAIIEAFGQSFLERLFAASSIRLGDAFIAAKQAVPNEEVNNSYTLLGDPGLMVSIPKLIEFNAERNIISRLQSESITVTSSEQTRTEKFLQGIVQLHTRTGALITSRIIPTTEPNWETQFTISSTYGNEPIVITVNLWNQDSKQFAAGRKVLNPIPLSLNNSKSLETIIKLKE